MLSRQLHARSRRALVGFGAFAWLALALALPAVAAAQESVMIDGARPELHVGVGWDGAIGIGARADIPIVPDGFISGLTDEFALSPGGELYFHDRGDGELSIGGVLCAQWNFYLHPEWSVFPELGLTLIFRDRDRGPGRDDDADVLLRPLVAAGGRWHFTRRNALVVRLAWPYGLQLGITF